MLSYLNTDNMPLLHDHRVPIYAVCIVRKGHIFAYERGAGAGLMRWHAVILGAFHKPEIEFVRI